MARRIFQTVAQHRQWRVPCPCQVGHRFVSSLIAADTVVPETSFSDDSQISLLASRDDLERVHTPSLYLKPSFNLAAYVNKSDTLQQLVKLGMDLHRLEKKPDLAQFVLGLNFEQQIQPHLMFLHDLGISADHLGSWLSKNPGIFKEDLDDLHVRITYLKSKRFLEADIKRIIHKNPYWLMFSTPKIDGRLGFVQRQFYLSAVQTRQLAVAQPRVITYSIEHIRKAAFTLVEEMGLDKEETKELVLKLPKILTMGRFSSLCP